MMIYTNLLFTFFSSGIEDNPTVFYKIIRGSTDQTNKYDTFYLQQRKEGDYTYADVKVNHPLDYERIKEYNLTVRVEVPIYFFKPPVVHSGKYFSKTFFGHFKTCLILGWPNPSRPNQPKRDKF